MHQSVTYITLTPEQFQEQMLSAAQTGAEKALEKYIGETKERPITKEEIMQRKGIKSDNTFYKLRRKKGVVAALHIGNKPLFNYSDFD